MKCELWQTSRIVRHRKGILVQLERGRDDFRVIVYGDYVESPLARTWHVAQKLARHQGQIPLFLAIYGGFCRFHVAAGTGFHLDKAEHVFVPTNQVQLTTVMR